MFKVYDRVWIMEDNKPKEKTVFAVIESMKQPRRDTQFYYHLTALRDGYTWGDGAGDRYHSRLVFKSKEELIESL